MQLRELTGADLNNSWGLGLGLRARGTTLYSCVVSSPWVNNSPVGWKLLREIDGYGS
jgi:hypothetical protein